MSEKVTIEISEADMAALSEWARNREEPLETLLGEALRQYMAAVREDHADLDRRMAGPEYEHEEAMNILAERRRQWRGEAAE
jgi:predicted transcriptional regulator